MVIGTTSAGPTTWIVVLPRCTECNAAGPIVEKPPETTVRITFTCTRSHCRKEQRQTL